MRAATAPAHLRPALLVLVAAGGTAGTAAREALVLTLPDAAGVQGGVLVANLTGALLLGLLLEALARSGADAGGRRLLRLGLGTGFCGGFTTYGSLAAACAVLLADGSTLPAVLYAATTVVLGGAATCAGVLLGAALVRRAA